MPTRLNDIETTFRLRVDSALKGFDQVSQAATRVEKKLENLAVTSTRIGVGLGAFGAAVTTAFGFAIKAANEEQQAIGELRATIEGTGDSFEQQRPKIESFIDGLAKTTRFTDNELRPALNRAVLATGDLDKGMRAAELGVKIAAAGFGNLEGNATLIARLFEGQVGAIGRLIPEFRDLEERLEAGATESALAAEALDRLNKIAANAPGPDAYNLLTKAIGELQETIGRVAGESLAPFITRLTQIIEAVDRFGQTGFGKAIINLTLFAGLVASVGGVLLIFVGQIFAATAAISAAGGLTAALGVGAKAVSLLALAFTGPAGLIAILIIAAGAIAALPVILNKMSAAADEARDKTFTSDRLTQFRAEMEKLSNVIEQFESGQISAKEAVKEFNKAGLSGIDQAKQRSAALAGIVQRLEEEKAASERASKADTAHGDLQAARIAKIIKKLDEEKQANFELDAAKEIIFERDKKRGEELLRQAGLFQPLPPPPPEPALPQIPGQELPKGIDFLTGETELKIAGITDQLNLSTEAVDEWLQALADGGSSAAQAILDARDAAVDFNDQLASFVAGTFDALATLGANFFVDLSQGFDVAAKNAAAFFKQLVADISAAIVKALILTAIISALPTGGFFGKVGKLLGGGLFQDARADQLARFEGSRFADLFFQGMFREFNTSQDRMASALTQNREINRDNSKSMTAIVNEATPETTVEFTDRHVEPRVRQRANQRSSRGTLTNAERDRLIEDHSRRLDELGFA